MSASSSYQNNLNSNSTSNSNANGTGLPASTSSSSLAPHSSSSASSTKDSFSAALQARNASNTYIAHLKIWENVQGEDAQHQPSTTAPTGTGSSSGRKARYLILALDQASGKVSLNKAKRNANGSFSIGKDWDLAQLREVEVYAVSSPS